MQDKIVWSGIYNIIFVHILDVVSVCVIKFINIANVIIFAQYSSKVYFPKNSILL